MDLEKVLSKFNVTKEDTQKIAHYLKPVSLKKGDIFIGDGKLNGKIGILVDGLMIATYISEKGKEEVARIYYPNSDNIIVSNHESFYYETFSEETIKAVEDSYLMCIKRDDLNTIYKKYPKFEEVAKQITEISYINAIKRIRQLQSYTAKERISNFFETNKSLFNRLTKQQLASYLAINRNDFSKFLNEI